MGPARDCSTQDDEVKEISKSLNVDSKKEEKKEEEVPKPPQKPSTGPAEK